MESQAKSLAEVKVLNIIDLLSSSSLTPKNTVWNINLSKRPCDDYYNYIITEPKYIIIIKDSIVRIKYSEYYVQFNQIDFY